MTAMSGRAVLLVLVAVALAVAIGFWIAGGDDRAAPDRDAPAGPVAASDSAPAASSAPASGSQEPATDKPAPRPSLAPAARDRLADAIERARSARLSNRSTSAKSEPSAPAAVLAIENKTGSNTAWEKRQIALLGELIGECFDLARVAEPELAGALGVQFSISAEPEVGGLVGDIAFMDDYSTIANAEMLECTRESLHAIELDPPPEGTRVDRQLTLRFGD